MIMYSQPFICIESLYDMGKSDPPSRRRWNVKGAWNDELQARGLGKSTNLSMLDAFLNLKYEGNDWFDGLEISKHH